MGSNVSVFSVDGDVVGVLQHAGFVSPLFREPRTSPTGKQHDSTLPEPWVTFGYWPSGDRERERDHDGPLGPGKEHDERNSPSLLPMTPDNPIERAQVWMIVVSYVPQISLDWARDRQVEPP